MKHDAVKGGAISSLSSERVGRDHRRALQQGDLAIPEQQIRDIGRFILCAQQTQRADHATLGRNAVSLMTLVHKIGCENCIQS